MILSPEPPTAPLPSNLLSIRSGRRYTRSSSLSWVAIRCALGLTPTNSAAIDMAGEVLGDRPAWAVGTKWERERDGDGSGPMGVLTVERRTRSGVIVLHRDQ